jgi:hypothetical protein
MEASLTYMQKVQLNYLATLTMCRIKMAHNGIGLGVYYFALQIFQALDKFIGKIIAPNRC